MAEPETRSVDLSDWSHAFDLQQHRVYRCENNVFRHRHNMTMNAVERLIEHLSPKLTIHVFEGKDGEDALAYPLRRNIILPPKLRADWVVCHEVAHILARHQYGRIAGHGREFCAVYLELLEEALGQREADQLRSEFDLVQVRYVVDDVA